MKPSESTLRDYLCYLQLPHIAQNYAPLGQTAAREQWPHLQYLARLIEGEALQRQERATQRRLKAARFPVLKTLDQFDWTWPKKVNQAQIQHLFRLDWVPHHTNVVFLGGVGLGKTHLATALGHAACLAGHSVLFTTAVDIVNTLTAAQAASRLKFELKRYLHPRVLLVDELGYLPIDKTGADLLFQVISQRYERGPLVITSNLAYKQWPKIFNDDAVLASAVLDRLLHHAETVTLQGKSYRMKDQLPEA